MQVLHSVMSTAEERIAALEAQVTVLHTHIQELLTQVQDRQARCLECEQVSVVAFRQRDDRDSPAPSHRSAQ